MNSDYISLLVTCVTGYGNEKAIILASVLY